MPKRTSSGELDSILQLILKHPEGLTLESIATHLQLGVTRRTLQRRLATMIANGQLSTSGAKRSTRYHTGKPIPREAKSGAPQDTKHINYQRKLLDDYNPNHTYYLSAETRQYLLKIGALSKNKNIQVSSTYSREILNRLLIDLSWNSSRLEGNTYSLLETENLLSAGKTADNKSSFETQMILNHKNAIEFLIDAANEITFNSYTILNLHALLSDNLLGNTEACGRLRSIPVAIHGTTFHPLDIPQLIEECFQLILSKASAIQDPFEQAFFLMVHLPYLQPFEDVNKRVSRLAANIPFIKNNLAPLSFIDVSDEVYIKAMLSVYEFNRIEFLRELFVWAYERSALRYTTIRHSLGEPDPFRLNYRTQIIETVTMVVKKMMDKKAAVAFIQQQANLHIPLADRQHYIEVVEYELLSLHGGNIARYQLRPAEFEAWHKNWI